MSKHSENWLKERGYTNDNHAKRGISIKLVAQYLDDYMTEQSKQQPTQQLQEGSPFEPGYKAKLNKPKCTHPELLKIGDEYTCIKCREKYVPKFLRK